MLITKEIEIDMAHRVPNHKSKCSSVHGHRYKIEAGVDDKIIDEEGASDEGMVIDFGDLKQIMMDEIDLYFDHSGVFYIEDQNIEELKCLSKNQTRPFTFVDFIPTAENLAKFWFDILEVELKKKKIKLHHVKVWETPTSTAIYTCMQ